MSVKKRYVVVVDMYVWNESDEGAKKQAKAITSQLSNREDCSANIIEIYEQPTGTIEKRKVIL